MIAISSLRRAAWLGVLAATVASAHLVPTATLHTPGGVANVADADGGTFDIRWIDGDPIADTVLDLYASREAISPFSFASAVASSSTRLNASEISLSSTANAYVWNLQGVAPGCYHVAAITTDLFERAVTVSPGVLAVRGPDDVPPTIWISNPTTDEVAPDGTFVLRYEVSDPDDPFRVTLRRGRYEASGLALVDLAGGLEHPPGTHSGSFRVDFKDARNGYYAFYAEVTSADDAGCASYWSFPLLVQGPFESGLDAGPDPADAGQHPGKGGCGCAGGPVEVVALLLLAPALAARRRLRSSSRQRSIRGHLNREENT